MTLTAVEKVQQSLYNIWTGASSSTEFEMGEQATTSTSNSDGPFDDPQKNQVWRVLASQMMASYDELADVDMLEPDPTNRKAALKHSRLAPFWIASEQKELTGLWSRDCFKRWKRGDLLKSDRVFGSRFHYHIKRDPKTGLITNCKVCRVVQGNTMKAGEDFEDAFSPVPHATAGRIIISLAAANDWELHCCDLAQAFIQADKLPEGVNGRVFIRPPAGAEEDDDVVYEVLRPLYGIPSSARALHLTLSKWFKAEGFVTAGFEDSVWIRPAGGKYAHTLVVSAHIDDTLMTSPDLDTLERFKTSFLTRFDGTDEGPVTGYVGC
jgi:hypothetical protein